MKLNIILNILGHNLVLGFGAGIEKDEEDEAVELLMSELHSETERSQVGFAPNEEYEDDEIEDRSRSRRVGFTVN